MKLGWDSGQWTVDSGHGQCETKNNNLHWWLKIIFIQKRWRFSGWLSSLVVILTFSNFFSVVRVEPKCAWSYDRPPETFVKRLGGVLMLRYLQLKWSQGLFTTASYTIKFMRKVLCVQCTWDVLAIVLSALVLDLVFREKNKQEINFDARRLLHTHKKKPSLSSLSWV